MEPTLQTLVLDFKPPESRFKPLFAVRCYGSPGKLTQYLSPYLINNGVEAEK